MRKQCRLARLVSHGIAVVVFLIAVPLYARDFSDPLARKVTEFLPTYNPFVPPLPPDRYFPDEVGETVSNAIIDGFLDNPEGVRRSLVRLDNHDFELEQEGYAATGLAPLTHALLFRSSPITGTGNAQNQLPVVEMDDTPDELLQKADKLYASEKRYRVARLFNWILSTFVVARLFLGAPASPSPYSAQGVISSVGNKSGPSARERKALALYQLFLSRSPQDPRAPEVRKKIDSLDAKRRKALVQAELDKANAAFKNEEYWKSNFHYQLALLIDEENSEAKAGVKNVEDRLEHYSSISHKNTSPGELALSRVKQAEWEHSKETLTYLLPGSGFVKDNLVVAGLQLGTEGLMGAATFGALTMVQTLGKLWHVMTGQAVSRQGIINEGEKYLLETDPEDRSPEIYAILANAYAREGKIEKAISYYKMAGLEDRIPDLREDAASNLLAQAESSPRQVDKRAYLRQVITLYPKTKASEKATEKLQEMPGANYDGLRLTKKFLLENPELFGPHGLALKRELYDGDWRNVELADEGVVLSPHGNITLHLESDTGPRTKIYAVPTEGWQNFWQNFRAKGYNDALFRDDQKISRLAQGNAPTDTQLRSEFEKNEETGWRMLPHLTGSVGEGFDVKGTLPQDILGTRLAFGRDQHSSYIGIEVPMPLVPVDFLLLGRNGLPSLYPKIRLPKENIGDAELYR